MIKLKELAAWWGWRRVVAWPLPVRSCQRLCEWVANVRRWTNTNVRWFLFGPILGFFWLEENQFAGRAYALGETPATWLVADYFCQQDNATLAIITSSQQDAFLREHFPNDAQTYVNFLFSMQVVHHLWGCGTCKLKKCMFSCIVTLSRNRV